MAVLVDIPHSIFKARFLKTGYSPEYPDCWRPQGLTYLLNLVQPA
jgi:hypothetical protein